MKAINKQKTYKKQVLLSRTILNKNQANKLEEIRILFGFNGKPQTVLKIIDIVSLEYLKKNMSNLSTKRILKDKSMMKQIRESEKNIKKGKLKELKVKK